MAKCGGHLRNGWSRTEDWLLRTRRNMTTLQNGLCHLFVTLHGKLEGIALEGRGFPPPTRQQTHPFQGETSQGRKLPQKSNYVRMSSSGAIRSVAWSSGRSTAGIGGIFEIKICLSELRDRASCPDAFPCPADTERKTKHDELWRMWKPRRRVLCRFAGSSFCFTQVLVHQTGSNPDPRSLLVSYSQRKQQSRDCRERKTRSPSGTRNFPGSSSSKTFQPLTRISGRAEQQWRLAISQGTRSEIRPMSAHTFPARSWIAYHHKQTFTIVSVSPTTVYIISMISFWQHIGPVFKTSSALETISCVHVTIRSSAKIMISKMIQESALMPKFNFYWNLIKVKINLEFLLGGNPNQTTWHRPTAPALQGAKLQSVCWEPVGGEAYGTPLNTSTAPRCRESGVTMTPLISPYLVRIVLVAALTASRAPIHHHIPVIRPSGMRHKICIQFLFHTAGIHWSYDPNVYTAEEKRFSNLEERGCRGLRFVVKQGNWSFPRLPDHSDEQCDREATSSWSHHNYGATPASLKKFSMEHCPLDPQHQNNTRTSTEGSTGYADERSVTEDLVQERTEGCNLGDAKFWHRNGDASTLTWRRPPVQMTGYTARATG
ncbi:unnamed protein product [Nesidiocoris tenuis]|uniref:Uncharacterized protein n=1 Tax=Nesidiocoris tenuis TaxID=355587 RepID=A0A6H5HG52_9HEMI|nr:unnamed protein product [Nesidiocoris tenuis]